MLCPPLACDDFCTCARGGIACPALHEITQTLECMWQITCLVLKLGQSMELKYISAKWAWARSQVALSFTSFFHLTPCPTLARPIPSTQPLVEHRQPCLHSLCTTLLLPNHTCESASMMLVAVALVGLLVLVNASPTVTDRKAVTGEQPSMSTQSVNQNNEENT